ncbi:superkiller viralicidic activity 2, putative [Ichthyophthirius multifiliis]|uniref:Superkiller viralicidic activity 2, putative n=1 Tax=Ichthyophthirius multifiliis TaxID=5932 RepID=G0QXV5_ICHMU|nr:superkiller viralicidic activity 2, putative [Ichthyophthirius multifiliis]EGR29952.1 superkiller viralicidic activity 2, putative [Ichthyophthirius multifiliis]|eukprot:XP_004031188.1 superkiller viralicidic activity 2, putative [Ichthyophthirius multifiliis]
MTTEILRSMLYRGSEITREVAWVIFDEVHYMRDKERGVVWEETIILLNQNVRYVFLSATIPNAGEFAEWITRIKKQPCHVVYTDYRPVPLQHFIFPTGGEGLYLIVDQKGNFREDNFQKALSVMGDNIDLVNLDKKKRKKPTEGADLNKILKVIVNKGLDPAIVFSFSKRDVESYAKSMGSMDLTSQEEKEKIDMFFNGAISQLAEEDQKLPQIIQILPILRRGIGMHHGGLLPIVKEIIEILFQQGRIKILFSTETFSMGVNMPARTVVFTSVRKFDGEDFRWIQGGEYIQMSGRAGRRGKDDKGFTILMVDQKMEPDVAKQMLKGQSDPLNSAFHLCYNMLINSMRLEDTDPEYIIRRSLLQFQNDKQLPEMEIKLIQLNKQYNEINIEYEGQISEIQENQPEEIIVVDIMIHIKKRANNEEPKPAKINEDGELEVIPMNLSCITELSSIKLDLPSKLDTQENKMMIKETLKEIHQSFTENIPTIHPIKDMKINNEQLDKIIDKKEKLKESKSKSEKKLLIKNVQQQIQNYEKKIKIKTQIEKLKIEIEKNNKIVLEENLVFMTRVMRRLSFLDKEQIVQLKGKVACEISACDEILATELLFANFFNDMTPNQIAAVLSCLVHDENSNQDNQQIQDKDLSKYFDIIIDHAKRIYIVMQESKMEIEEKDYLSTIKPQLIDVVYKWAQGDSFSDISKLSNCYEGSIIRSVRRLDELLKQMEKACEIIGNEILQQKFKEASKNIKRGIIFAASLYI